jgi:hypothetical protein
VYGPVRTVVWQGSVGDHRPYADPVNDNREFPRNPAACGELEDLLYRGLRAFALTPGYCP